MQVDYQQLAKEGVSAKDLAGIFLREYFGNRPITYPMNPFQMLRDSNVIISFRPFVGYEGAYIPPDEDGGPAVVGINLDRPITRQRYTAAHELCHHLKDRGEQPTLCLTNSSASIERYAEEFAAELLMPREELLRQVEHYACDGFVVFDAALKIAHHFGVSFSACVNQLAYQLKVIPGDVSPQSLKERREAYGPNRRKNDFGLTDTALYEQLFDSSGDLLQIDATPRVRQRFETEFVFHDARMEGVDIERSLASEIVVDLRLNKQGSKFCKEANQNIIEVAGLTLAYDYVFDKAQSDDEISIYDAKAINSALYSTAVFPQYAGEYRQANPVVVGGGFETADYRSVPLEMMELGREYEALFANASVHSCSALIERIADLHHKLTVVHPFRDGNGRTMRAFANLLLLRHGLPPVLFDAEKKEQYKNALAEADATEHLDALYELYFRQMLKSYSILTDIVL